MLFSLRQLEGPDLLQRLRATETSVNCVETKEALNTGYEPTYCQIMALPQNSACYYFGLKKSGTGYGKISLLLKNMGRRKDIIYTSSQLQPQLKNI